MSDDATLQAHAVRLMVLKRQLDKAKAAYTTASNRAHADFADARNRGIQQIKGRLPDGEEGGLFTILTGGTSTTVDEDLLLSIIAAGAPGDIEDYVLPAAFEDDRVIKLLNEHFPEFVQVRITRSARALLDVQIGETGGYIADPATGDREKVADVERLDATGVFQFRPGSRFEHMITAALEAGLITEDGTIKEDASGQ